jgi:hypothetical protein
MASIADGVGIEQSDGIFLRSRTHTPGPSQSVSRHLRMAGIDPA